MADLPTYEYEEKLRSKGYSTIAGVDEVGRGPIAGPVYAAAVILNPNHIPVGLNDSKKLSAKKRTLISEEIMKHADISIGSASEREIEEINILRASHLAMMRAIEGLKSTPNHVLIDGNLVPRDLTIPAIAVVRGRCPFSFNCRSLNNGKNQSRFTNV
jgi:ribonuclease HII